MASLERRGNRYRIIFRLGGRKHYVSVKSTDRKDAEACLVRLEEKLRLVERGRITIPDGADVGLFLLSDGKLEKSGEAVRSIRLAELFRTYQTQFTAGAKEAITREMEDIHMKHLARIIGGQTPLAAITAGTVQQFVDARSREEHNGHRRHDHPRRGPVPQRCQGAAPRPTRRRLLPGAGVPELRPALSGAVVSGAGVIAGGEEPTQGVRPRERGRGRW